MANFENISNIFLKGKNKENKERVAKSNKTEDVNLKDEKTDKKKMKMAHQHKLL